MNLEVARRLSALDEKALMLAHAIKLLVVVLDKRDDLIRHDYRMVLDQGIEALQTDRPGAADQLRLIRDEIDRAFQDG